MRFKIKKELFLEKLFLLVILVFTFLTMYYYDNQSIFVSVIRNMHRITSGKWYCLLNGWTLPYGVVSQAACAVWAVPVFALSEYGIISVTSVGARLWYKLFMLLFLALSTREIGKIAVEIGGISEKKILWMKLFFLSSLMVLLPAVHVAQLDIVYLFFVLKGIEYYLNGEHFKFLISFMFAIPGKYMPLFIFIPLVLLKEKRYLYIIRDLAVGCALCVADRGIKSAGYCIENYLGIDTTGEAPQSNVVLQQDWEELLSSNINVFGVPVSLVLCAFFMLCIWCFVQKSEDRKKLAIWVSFLGFSILFALGMVTPYWIILLIPFEMLLIFGNNSGYEILFPMETIFSVAFLYTFILKISWIFGSFDTFDFLLFKLIPGYENRVHGFVSDFMKQRGLDPYSGVAVAMLVACIVGILALTYPLRKREGDVYDEEREECHIRGWYWARLGLAYGWILLNIWVVALNHVAA